MLETSHPPVYYLPRAAVDVGVLEPARGSSFCEFTGAARYDSVRRGAALAECVGWFYPNPNPNPGYELLKDRGGVPSAMDSCEVVGEPGTMGWQAPGR